MGYGNYSYEAHQAIARGRAALPRQAVFKQTRCHPLMDPRGIRLRESRDAEAHPSSLAVIFALDVTGSMGAIPEQLAKRELPGFMKTLLDCGVADPQVLFMAVGDATCDRAPLQVGQFESAAKEMDQWLTWSYLEGGGGGGGTESYELPIYFAARHTAIDCWEKRRQRGFLFLTGDENPYPAVSRLEVEHILGETLPGDLSLANAIAEAQRTYEPFFLIPDLQRRTRCERTWRDVLGDHVICLEDPADTCQAAAGLVGLQTGAISDLDQLAQRLEGMGLAPPRIGAIVRALTPFAASLDRAGLPEPRLTTGLGDDDRASGMSRS